MKESELTKKFKEIAEVIEQATVKFDHEVIDKFVAQGADISESVLMTSFRELHNLRRVTTKHGMLEVEWNPMLPPNTIWLMRKTPYNRSTGRIEGERMVEMGDMADVFRELKEINKLARWQRHEKSIEALEQSGVPFIEKANGHCIVGEGDLIFDFWATKGLFIQRGTGKRGNGIDKLLKLVMQAEPGVGGTHD